MNRETEIVFVSDEARAILMRRGVTFDAAVVKRPRPGVTIVGPARSVDNRPAAVQLREHMKNAPNFGGDSQYQRRTLELQNMVNAEYWNPPVAAKGAKP
jgi:hypothetical protein